MSKCFFNSCLALVNVQVNVAFGFLLDLTLTMLHPFGDLKHEKL